MGNAEFEFDCNVPAAFVMNPNEHQRFGYITKLEGFGLGKELKNDLRLRFAFNKGTQGPNFKGLTVYPPQGTDPVSSVKVVGVIEKFEWDGGVVDPIKLVFYVSQENAVQIMSVKQRALKTLEIKSLGWWIADYDQETKQWFEQSHPNQVGGGVISGRLNGRLEPALDIDLTPDVVKEGIDVNVYKVEMDIIPAGKKTHRLFFYSSPKHPVVRKWGILIGSG